MAHLAFAQWAFSMANPYQYYHPEFLFALTLHLYLFDYPIMNIFHSTSFVILSSFSLLLLIHNSCNIELLLSHASGKLDEYLLANCV